MAIILHDTAQIKEIACLGLWLTLTTSLQQSFIIHIHVLKALHASTNIRSPTFESVFPKIMNIAINSRLKQRLTYVASNLATAQICIRDDRWYMNWLFLMVIILQNHWHLWLSNFLGIYKVPKCFINISIRIAALLFAPGKTWANWVFGKRLF